MTSFQFSQKFPLLAHPLCVHLFPSAGDSKRAGCHKINTSSPCTTFTVVPGNNLKTSHIFIFTLSQSHVKPTTALDLPPNQRQVQDSKHNPNQYGFV